MKIDQEQNSSIRVRQVPIVRWSMINLLLCILIGQFRSGIVLAESLYLRKSDQSVISEDNPLEFVKRLDFSFSKSIKSRLRTDLLNELDCLSGQVIWRNS